MAACGGSALDPGSGNDPGGGTQTLVVDGSVHADATVTNARTATEFTTDFSVRISLNTQPVTTGTVTVTSATGSVPLAFQSVGDRAGRWTGNAPGYDEVYVLDVVSGPDEINGVRVDGPDIHTFSTPTAGATVDSTMPLAIAWDCGDTAEAADVDVQQLDPIAIEDSGTYSLAPGSLRAERDKARANTIGLARTNTVVPSGAAGGSQWSVQITNSIDVIAQPNPAL